MKAHPLPALREESQITSQAHPEKLLQSQPARFQRQLYALHRAAGNHTVGLLLRTGLLQPRPESDRPDTLDEREANRTEAAIADMPASNLGDRAGPLAQSARPLAGLPDDLNFLKTGGRPLPGGERAWFESRLGQPLDRVRLHTGPQAARSAEDLSAQAYTVGQNIVFGPGRYNPHSRAGRGLLAHELTHVVQQASRRGAGPRLQRKPKTAAKPVFYQEVLDAIAREQKSQVRLTKSTFGGFALPFLRLLEDLSRAVDTGDRAAVRRLAPELVKEDFPILAPKVRSDSFYRELISRTLLLGLVKEAAMLRAWYVAGKKTESPYPGLGGKYAPQGYLWETTVENALAAIPGQDADAATAAFDGLVHVLRALRDEWAGLDKKAVQENRRIWADIAGLSGAFFMPDRYSLAGYYDQLVVRMQEVTVGLQRAFQVILDRAIRDLEAGKGPTNLKRAREKLALLPPLVGPKDKSKRILGLQVEVTRSQFTKRGGRHLDYFLTGKAARARSIGIEYYDQESGETLAEEKKLDLERIIMIRRRQIALLERLYGEERDKKGAVTAESAENKRIITGPLKGKMGLHSNENWRRFVLEKFRLRRKEKGPAEAFVHVVRLLELYLQAFTTHTPFNIEDFGDNYLTKTFPRALTGQLIHDCGVYALRIAYILSLVRQELGLKFRFVLLPVHVGLAVTGDKLPTVVAHNDTFWVFQPGEVAALRKQWQETNKQGEKRPPVKLDENQFLGELAAPLFISSVDMPFLVFDAPEPKGSDRDVKRKLWQFYTTTATQSLFSARTRDPKSPAYQFHLRYLEVLQKNKEWYNTFLVPAWNVKAHGAWLKHRQALTTAFNRLKKAGSKEKKAAREAYNGVVAPYMTKIQAAFKPAMDAKSGLIATRVELSVDLDKHPEVLAKGVRISPHERLDLGDWAMRVVLDYLTDLRRGQSIKPPFADKDDLLWPAD